MNILKTLKQKKGFTLVEIIVVLLILAILAAIAIPSMIGYVKEARESEDYQYVGLLNRATSGYKAYVYKDKGEIPGDDIFYGINSDQQREQTLLDHKLIDELYQSKKTGTYFQWDIDSQRWIVGDGKSKPSKDGTILDDLINGNDTGNWNDKTLYNYNDLVTYTDKEGNSYTYKCLVETCKVGQFPGYTVNGQPYDAWKKVDLNYDLNNLYERGDIVKHDGKYYRAKLEYPYQYPGYKTPASGLYNCFEEVEKQDDGSWLTKPKTP